VVLALPLHYSFALVNQWLWARVEDRPLRITDGFASPDRLLVVLEQAHNAMLCLVGVHVPLLDRFFGDRVFDGIARLHFAGGRFPQESVPWLHRLFPNARIFNNYGCAEAMPRLTLRSAEASTDAANIGRPLPTIELRRDDDGALVFRSPYGAVGFVEDERWHAIEPSEWVATGDLGDGLEDGTWRLSGRASEVFKRHGEKVSIPAILESVFSSWNGQAGCYTTHDRLGEQGYVLVLAPQPSATQVRQFLGVLRAHPRSSWPLRIESRDTLPLLPNGKVDAHALREGSDVQWHQRI
jgi:acyl-CoA synthetase (AMP-forming)/AMP-acid ligase II